MTTELDDTGHYLQMLFIDENTNVLQVRTGAGKIFEAQLPDRLTKEIIENKVYELCLINGIDYIAPETVTQKTATALKDYWFRSIKVGQGTDSNQHDKTADKSVKRYAVMKYSFKGSLYEAIKLGGLPTFVSYQNEQIMLAKELQEPGRILQPFIEDEPTPYSFKDIAELESFINLAKKETLFSLYGKTKSTLAALNDIEHNYLILAAADFVFTYFQDKIGMTNYLFLYGLPGTGKGAMLESAHQLAYRAVLVTSATSASVYRTLGTIEPGQACILIDEANSLGENADLMEVLKTGYKQNGQVPRVLDASSSTHTSPTWFKTFGWKMIAAEHLPSEYKASGFLTRCFKTKTYLGRPSLKIDKVVAHGGNPELLKLFNKIVHLRKLLFAYRLIHYDEPIGDVKLNIDGRDEELCSGLVRLFKDTLAITEILTALTELTIEKQSAICDSFDAYVHARVKEIMLAKSDKNFEFEFSVIWNTLRELLSGSDVPGKPQSMRTDRYGDISKRLVSQTLQKFGASAGKDSTGNKRILKIDEGRFNKFADMFTIPTSIQIIHETDTLTLPTLYDEVRQQNDGIINNLGSSNIGNRMTKPENYDTIGETTPTAIEYVPKEPSEVSDASDMPPSASPIDESLADKVDVSHIAKSESGKVHVEGEQ